MNISDLDRHPHGEVFTSSLCIVGSGPAGLTIATELANTHHDVLVLESGGRSREETFSAALNEIESVGEPRVLDQRTVRNRVLGGSSHTWSGRCTTLDELDFVPRPWVPHSGWPIGPAAIAPYLRRAADSLGLESTTFDSRPQESVLAKGFGLHGDSDLRPVSWQFSTSPTLLNDYVRFGPRFARMEASNIRVLTHATVTNIVTTRDGRHVLYLEVKSLSGSTHRVYSHFFVLAGGGIENARMLLASNSIDPAGVGNRKDLVGRFLLDHPRATVGAFAPQHAPTVQKFFGLHRGQSGARVQCGLSLSNAVQARESMLNCAAWTTQQVADDDVWRALRSFGARGNRSRHVAGRAICKGVGQIPPAIWNKFVRRRGLPRRLGPLHLDVMVEQAPDSASRIRLSHRHDALGVPLSIIDWRLGSMERATVLRLGLAVNAALTHAGLPAATLVDWVQQRRPQDAVFTDPAHPMGTTRMAASDASGVVDLNSRVFGVDNLYLAGSSVFPTASHANPTLTIVALAIRLAETLRRDLPQGLCVPGKSALNGDGPAHRALPPDRPRNKGRATRQR